VLEILHRLSSYLPKRLYSKLKRFIKTEESFDSTPHSSVIHWKDFKNSLDKIDLSQCRQEIRSALNNNTLTEKNVKIFHIADNKNINGEVEPNSDNTNAMIYNFLRYIYHRNIIATLLKYILLKPILIKMEHFCNDLATKKSTFFTTFQRLNEIIFESVLTSFNGANYDNFLICNDLIKIVTKMKQTIKIFKKGAAISSILIKCKRNIMAKQPRSQKLPKKNLLSQWPMNLYIKDIRYLLAPNMTLDKIGKLFNLKVSKLCFPYDQATSIEKLKNTYSLNPTNEEFWIDRFSGKTVDVQNRLQAQQLFEDLQFSDLYQYSVYYLIQDCFLLHSILLTIFHTYLNESINIFLRRIYTQSSLAFQQFFIVNPAQQIEKVHAPKQINHPFYNYFIRQSVTGGFCTSFVHGLVGKNNDCPINEHLKYFDPPTLCPSNWPNFKNIHNWKKAFHEKATCISTIDIRSLYPSASVKNIPVGNPLFYTRIPESLQEHYNTVKNLRNNFLNINMFCSAIRNQDHQEKSCFVRINKVYKGQSEYHALKYYLQQHVPKSNIKILRFQSQFTALGQFYFGEYPVDGFLSYRDHLNRIHIKIIQYNSTYCHGHKPTCPAHEYQNRTSSDTTKYKEPANVKENILNLWKEYVHHFNLSDIQFEYIEIWDCDFPHHKVPIRNPYLSMNSSYTYDNFLRKILSREITGLLVLHNLEIKKINQNPLFGFLIQKATYGYDKLSPYTQEKISKCITSRRVIGMHKAKSFIILNTEYFVWLYNTFGFESTPDIYHALCFQLDDYMRSSLEDKLMERATLKTKIKNETNSEIKQNLEIKAELIKLMLNSSYGYTLCNLSSSKFKEFTAKYSIPKSKRLHKFKSGIQIDAGVFLFEVNPQHQYLFQTMLGHVGSYILFHSKKILAKRLLFLLKYLNPTKAQLCYMDTDSAHFLLKFPNFIDNVDPNLQHSFHRQFDKHFDSGSKLSGIWVHENIFDNGNYLGEKSYDLYNDDDNHVVTHMKGLNKQFQAQFHNEGIDTKQYPIISCNLFFKSPDFTLFKVNIHKSLFENFAPIKRYFISSFGSVPLKL